MLLDSSLVLDLFYELNIYADVACYITLTLPKYALGHLTAEMIKVTVKLPRLLPLRTHAWHYSPALRRARPLTDKAT